MRLNGLNYIFLFFVLGFEVSHSQLEKQPSSLVSLRRLMTTLNRSFVKYVKSFCLILSKFLLKIVWQHISA